MFDAKPAPIPPKVAIARAEGFGPRLAHFEAGKNRTAEHARVLLRECRTLAANAAEKDDLESLAQYSEAERVLRDFLVAAQESEANRGRRGPEHRNFSMNVAYASLTEKKASPALREEWLTYAELEAPDFVEDNEDAKSDEDEMRERAASHIAGAMSGVLDGDLVRQTASRFLDNVEKHRVASP